MLKLRITVARPAKASWQQDEKQKPALPTLENPLVPTLNELTPLLRESFATGRPLEDSPSLVYCKHCRKSIAKSVANDHITRCLQVKREKAQRKKEAKEARDRAKAREDGSGVGAAGLQDDSDDYGSGDSDSDEDSRDVVGNRVGGKSTGSKTSRKAAAGAQKSSVEAGKKRKADVDDKQSKKRKEEPKGKASKGKGPVDVEKQCGVLLPNGQMCARSLTCKSHSMGAKRAVPGRSLPYDMLLAAYQKKNHARQHKAALDAHAASLEDEDVEEGPVDSDEETAAVMTALSSWAPRPVVPQPVFAPIRKTYGLARLHEQLFMATNGGRTNIFRFSGFGAQRLPQQGLMHPAVAMNGHVGGAVNVDADAAIDANRNGDAEGDVDADGDADGDADADADMDDDDAMGEPDTGLFGDANSLQQQQQQQQQPQVPSKPPPTVTQVPLPLVGRA